MKHDGYDEFRGKKITIPLEQYRMLCDLAMYSDYVLREFNDICECDNDRYAYKYGACEECQCKYDVQGGDFYCATEKVDTLLDSLHLPNKNDEEIMR